jgi:membrane protease subunit (stomatin/prohibitin family)
MGVFDFVKNGARQLFVARPDHKKHLIVYKHPDGNIPLGNRVTVDQDECAVFFRDGRAVGVLGPGQTPVDAHNIPFLAPIINAFTGGNALLAEIYFVKTTPVRGVTFGGSAGDIVDPSTKLQVPLRIFGEFAVQVTDPMRFVVGYAGQAAAADDNDLVLKWIRDKFLMSVATVLTGLCEAEHKSVRNVLNDRERLAQAFMARAPNLDEVGIRIVEMGKLEPNVAPEHMQMLRDAENSLAQEELSVRKKQIAVEGARAEAQARQFALDQQFQQEYRNVQGLAGGNLGAYAGARMAMGAAEGMATHGVGEGVAGLGAQLAMGAGIGQVMGQVMGQQAATAAAVGAACAACGHAQAPGKFCRECGAPMAAAPKACPSCHAQLEGAAKFCAACGARVG